METKRQPVEPALTEKMLALTSLFALKLTFLK